jgi:hypothetical protein
MKVVQEEEDEEESDVHWRKGGVVSGFVERWREWGLGRAKWVEKCVRSVDLPRLPVNPVMHRIVSNVSRNRRRGNRVRAFARKPSPNHLQFQTS